MVFDYADFDLTGLMESTKYQFTEPQVRALGALGDPWCGCGGKGLEVMPLGRLCGP